MLCSFETNWVEAIGNLLDLSLCHLACRLVVVDFDLSCVFPTRFFNGTCRDLKLKERVIQRIIIRKNFEWRSFSSRLDRDAVHLKTFFVQENRGAVRVLDKGALQSLNSLVLAVDIDYRKGDRNSLKVHIITCSFISFWQVRIIVQVFEDVKGDLIRTRCKWTNSFDRWWCN